jgi:lipopolysaccharide export LptBFGC system permease protein LptF
MKRLKHILKETVIITGIILFVLIASSIDSLLDIAMNHFCK